MPSGRWGNAENLISQAQRFLMPPADAKATVDQLEQRVSGSWHRVARAAGVSERDCRTIAGAFVYPGFRLPSKPR